MKIRTPSILRTLYWKQKQRGIHVRTWDDLLAERVFDGASLAVVGNAGYLRDAQLGSEIDRHDFVLRMNDFGVDGFQRAVGRRIDIFMTMNSILGGFRTCETGLGAKRHKPSAPKLGPMFIQVVSTAFLTVLRNFDVWKEAKVIDQPPLYGLRHMEPPQDLTLCRAF